MGTRVLGNWFPETLSLILAATNNTSLINSSTSRLWTKLPSPRVPKSPKMKYWKGIEELESAPEFMQSAFAEFMPVKESHESKDDT